MITRRCSRPSTSERQTESTAQRYRATVWHEPIRRGFGGQASRLHEIGLATYPLYLLHAPLGAAIMLGLRRLGVGQEIALTAAIASAVTLAFVVSLLIERPIQSGLGHALTRRTTAAG